MLAMVSLQHARYTGTHLKSYRNKPGVPEVIGANGETLVKYLKEIKGYSSKTMTWPTAQLKCLYINSHGHGQKTGGVGNHSAARKL